MDNEESFFGNFFNNVAKLTECIGSTELMNVAKLIRESSSNGKIIIAGNGGSAAIASHVSVDLTKAVNIKSTNFNESSLLTCLSNDYGYDHWLEMALEFYANSNDLVILISSSGQSKNIINGAKKAKERELPLVTLSGFSPRNQLRGMGDINLWVDSLSYNVVESVHQMWLLSIVDYLIEKNNLEELG